MWRVHIQNGLWTVNGSTEVKGPFLFWIWCIGLVAFWSFPFPFFFSPYFFSSFCALPVLPLTFYSFFLIDRVIFSSVWSLPVPSSLSFFLSFCGFGRAAGMAGIDSRSGGGGEEIRLGWVRCSCGMEATGLTG
jgi:hypothetical protein